VEQVTEYLEANKAFEAAKANVSSMTKAIQSYGRDLQTRPKDAFFVNASILPPTKSGVHFIHESLAWDAKDWPSADQINQVLLDYIQSEQRIKTVWQAMPSELQAAMKPPKYLLS